jgi:hypothetical protein
VDANGRVDVSKMPKHIPALDPSGKTIGYVSTSDLFADEDATSLPLYDDARGDTPNGRRVVVGGAGLSAAPSQR